MQKMAPPVSVAFSISTWIYPVGMALRCNSEFRIPNSEIRNPP
jgi:hypothetical protein